MCSLFYKICESCVAVGGLATFFTLLWLIFDSRCKSKRINRIQQIQSLQLESLFEPDIRISSYSSGTVNEIVISNHGENLIILGISETNEQELLNMDGMKNWFPRNFDKNIDVYIPLSHLLSSVQSHIIMIKCLNRLGTTYESEIRINDGKPIIKRPVTKS